MCSTRPGACGMGGAETMVTQLQAPVMLYHRRLPPDHHSFTSDDILRRGGKPRDHRHDNMVRIKQAAQVQRLKAQVGAVSLLPCFLIIRIH